MVIENELLTDIQNFIDMKQKRVEEINAKLANNETSYLLATEHQNLVSQIFELKKLIKPYSHKDDKLGFDNWWKHEGRQTYTFCSYEIIARVEESCRVAWSNGAVVALESQR